MHSYEYHPKPVSYESLTGAKDATLGSMRTTGSNPKRAMLCSEMQSINSETSGMRNQENNPEAATTAGAIRNRQAVKVLRVPRMVP